MKTRFLFILVKLGLVCSVYSRENWTHGRLRVSENGHYLVYEDGIPFFWLGDTGWEMLARLNRSEINQYLDNRSKKGFSVIQTVLVSEFIHMDKLTNYYGDRLPDERKEGVALWCTTNMAVY